MKQILVAGIAVVDMVFQVDEMPRHTDKYRAADAHIVGGGCAANAAVAVARLGGGARLASRLGDDAIATLILAGLHEEKVDTSAVYRCSGGKSAFSSVYVDKQGERQIMNFPGSELIDEADWLKSDVTVDAILADNRWPQLTLRTMALAQAREIPGIIDAEQPIDLQYLQQASHVAFSRQGLTALTGEADLKTALHTVSKKISAWVGVTDGEAGVYFLRGRKIEHIPAFKVEVKDTLAAGDVWHGAFALRLAEGADEPSAIEFANAAAALKCIHHGGRAGCPDRETTDNFLRENR